MSLSNAVSNIATNSAKLAQVVAGDRTTVVETPAGPLPSLSKLIHDAQDRLDQALELQRLLVLQLGEAGGAALVKTADGKTVQAALDLKASVNYVDAKYAAVITQLTGGAPETLNAFNELAAALGNDANFAGTTANALGSRLRFDTAAQGLTAQQQTNAQTNLGMSTVKYDIGILQGQFSSAALTLGEKANKQNDTLIKPTIKGYIEQFQTLNGSLTYTVNTDNGTLIEITTTGNTTVNLPAPVAGMSYAILVKYGAAHTVQFVPTSGTLGWFGKGTGTNTAPQATMIANKIDAYAFVCGTGYTKGRDAGRNG